jgi:hypothetical protein
VVQPHHGCAPPPAPPLGLIFHLGALACMGILGMLVSYFYSLESECDRAGYTCSHVESRIFKLQHSHDLVIKSGISCDQHVSRKIEQESWFV